MLDTSQRVFLAVISAGLLAQTAKILIHTMSRRESFRPADLVVTGGMPSTHSALSTALSLSIYFAEGLTTTFLVSLAFTAVVLRDALGVRRTAGEEGRIINQLIRKTRLRVSPVHYSLGHTPAEVTVGVIIGLLTAIVTLFV